MTLLDLPAFSSVAKLLRELEERIRRRKAERHEARHLHEAERRARAAGVAAAVDAAAAGLRWFAYDMYGTCHHTVGGDREGAWWGG